MVRIVECTQQHLDSLAANGEYNLLAVLQSAGFSEVHRVSIVNKDYVIHCRKFFTPSRIKAFKDFCQSW